VKRLKGKFTEVLQQKITSVKENGEKTMKKRQLIEFSVVLILMAALVLAMHTQVRAQVDTDRDGFSDNEEDVTGIQLVGEPGTIIFTDKNEPDLFFIRDASTPLLSSIDLTCISGPAGLGITLNELLSAQVPLDRSVTAFQKAILLRENRSVSADFSPFGETSLQRAIPFTAGPLNINTGNIEGQVDEVVAAVGGEGNLRLNGASTTRDDVVSALTRQVGCHEIFHAVFLYIKCSSRLACHLKENSGFIEDRTIIVAIKKGIANYKIPLFPSDPSRAGFKLIFD
jgi:hypothetical protein